MIQFAMDSLSQIALGASIAIVATSGTKHRRIIFWAAFLATLPDLDIFFPAANDLELALSHRTWTHSWIIQSLIAPFAAWLIYKIDKTLNYLHWLLIVWLVWVTHSALDVFTVYGTHIFWPFGGESIFLANVFIIDPLYTLPFLLTLILAFFSKTKNAYRLATAGLIISNVYLLWTLSAQKFIFQRTVVELKKQNISYEKIFIGPTYFNSFLWRIVVLKKEKYYEAFSSVFDKTPNIYFSSYSRNLNLISSLKKEPVIKKLKYFSHDYYAVELADKKRSIRVVDLRMGWSANYYFKYKIAEIKSSKKTYKIVTPQRITSRPLKGEIKNIWNRIWNKTKL
ncbi:MAG: metal-dependent hydrolase [Bdellovibrionales bacterium]|nr:metal-dependent hydrolase [Bdellovibrionales bacterium]